jgi:hypothetical protein
MNTTALIAIIGSVTTSIGTLYGIWTAYEDRRKRGRSNVKLTVMESAYIVGDTEATTKEVTFMRVANLGDHDITISAPGAVFLKRAGAMIYSPLTIQGSHTAAPHKTVEIFAPLREDDEPKIAYYLVTTTLGEEFRYYVVPKWRVKLRNFLHKTHLHRMPSVKIGVKNGKKRDT